MLKAHPYWNGEKIGPHIFPRMWDNGNERNQEYVYRTFGGMDGEEQPTFANNIRYFAKYQFSWMYMRYFMWNFAGKQNDLQGFGNRRDGNFASGIDFMDKFLGVSTPDTLPATAGKNNKANNKLYFLPFILGSIGFVYQLIRGRRDWLVSFLLFFFTGFAIVIYLNQSGYQPRERDYAYVGSFYAFAIWIGLGVLCVRDWLNKLIKGPVADYAAFGICLLAVPILMASQEWDDHDRSKKVLARDLGKNYLQSCDTNAILITFGDNDTYPLWYAQEVEKIRPDLRVMNYSLLGTDWYINQLRYKVNQSAPADVIFTPEQIHGNKRDFVFTASYLSRYNVTGPLQGFDQNKYYPLYDLLKNVTGSEDQKYKVPLSDEDWINVLPVNKVSIPVNVEEVKRTMSFNPGDSILSELKLDITKGVLQKNDLAVLSLIAANLWKRPIYFTSTQELEELGLEKYVRLEGLSYRLVPVQNSNVELNLTFKNIMNKFAYGNANKNGVYFDEENRRHINTIRQSHAFLAMGLVDAGKKDSATKVLQKYDANVSEANAPYGMTSNRGNLHNRVSATFLYAAYRSGDMNLAKKVHQSLKSDLDQQMRYYQTLGDAPLNSQQLYTEAVNYMNQRPNGLSEEQSSFANDILSAYQMLQQLNDWQKQFDPASLKPGENTPSPIGPPDTTKTPDSIK